MKYGILYKLSLQAQDLYLATCVAMPFASVEDWRARIGLCWCALGRPFKTSTLLSEDYQPCAALSGSAVLQAVCALMAVVLVQGIESINGCVIKCQRRIKSESVWRESCKF